MSGKHEQPMPLSVLSMLSCNVHRRIRTLSCFWLLLDPRDERDFFHEHSVMSDVDLKISATLLSLHIASQTPRLGPSAVLRFLLKKARVSPSEAAAKGLKQDLTWPPAPSC